MSKLVGQNPLLTAELLRVVNTPYFGLATEVKSVQHALGVLGMKAVRNLVLCLAVRDLLSSNDIDGFEHQLFREDTLRWESCEMCNIKVWNCGWREASYISIPMVS